MDNTESIFDEYGDNNMLEDFMNLPSEVSEPNNILTQNDAKSDSFSSGMDILQQSLLSADILGAAQADDFSFDDMGFTVNSNNYSDPSNPLSIAKNPIDTEDDSFFDSLNTQDNSNVIQGFKPIQNQTMTPSPQNVNVAPNVISNQGNHFTMKVSNSPQESTFLSSSTPVQNTPVISVPFSNLNQSQGTFVGRPAYLNSSNIQDNPIAPTNSVIQQQAVSAPIVIQLNRNQQKSITPNNIIQVQNYPSQYQSNVQIVNQQPVQIISSQSIQNVSQPIQIANQQPVQILNQSIQIANNPSLRIVKQPIRIVNQPFQLQNQPISNQTVQIVNRPVQIVNQQSVQNLPSQPQVFNSNQYTRVTNSPVISNKAQSTNQALIQQNPVGQNNTLFNVVQNQSIQQSSLNQAPSVTPQNSTDSFLEQQTNKLATLLQAKATKSGVNGIIRIGNQNYDITTVENARKLAATILQQQKQLKLQQNQTKTTIAQSHNHNATRQVISTAQTQSMISLSGLLAKSVTNSSDNNKTQYVVTSVATAMPGRLTPQNLLRASPGPQLKSSSPSPGINRIQIASVNIPISAPATTVPNPAHAFLTSQNLQSSSGTLTTDTQSLPTTTVKVNLASQQTRNMSKEQIQKLIQNQAASQVHSSPTIVNANLQQSNNTGDLNTPIKIENGKIGNSITPSILTFRVDPNLTLQQVEQIQYIIANKVPLSKISPLTKEQKQLLAAFRAQLRSMDQPIQQYYLRNPQLFLQKVFQHLQTGKPFLMHMQAKVNSQANNTNLNNTAVKSIHPTISLSAGGENGLKPKMQSIKVGKVLSNKPDTPITVQQVRGIKRLSATPPTSKLSNLPQKRPTLVIEQLQRHQELVVTPDYKTPFLNIRDACRRLLPYHSLNAPEIKPHEFENSEPMFNKISKQLIERKDKMLARYQVLFLKDSARNTCSSDAVMLQRAFLQHEKAALAEDKQKINEDPLSIKEFLPPDEDHKEFIDVLERERAVKDQISSLSIQMNTRNFSSESYSCHTPSYFMDENRSNTNSIDMSSTLNEYEPIECEVVTTGTDDDFLLQEAVDSIMH